MADIFTPPMIWMTIGCVLILAEIIVPGGIAFFLGGACLVVSASLYVGLIEKWTSALMLFFFSSTILFFMFKNLMHKWFGGDSSVGYAEDEPEQGIAMVIETIGPGEQAGRVDFEGTQWKATSDGTTILPDTQVTVLSKNNISLIVEPFSELDILEQKSHTQ
jgi:inner membrane protein